MGDKLLYMKVQKALYRMLKSALLVYKKLRRDFEDEGFKVNPYDPCMANKQINRNQINAVWHEDNLKVSHHDPWNVTKIAIYLPKLYRDKKVQLRKNWNILE